MVLSFSFNFIRAFGKRTVKPHFAAPDLGMRCLYVSHKKDARLNLVKGNG